MVKEKFEKSYNVNLGKVTFKEGNNGLFEYSVKDTSDGHYIIKEGEAFYMVRNNGVVHYVFDASELES